MKFYTTIGVVGLALMSGTTHADLVSWWEGNGNALDSVGAHHGTLWGDVSYGMGRDGRLAFDFAGLNGVVRIGDPPGLKLTGSMSISAWVFARSYESFAQILFRGDDRGSFDPYYLSSWLFFHVESLVGQSNVHATGAPLRTWTHLLATLDAETGIQRIYKNGILEQETVTSIRPFRDLDPAYHPGVSIGNVQYPQGGVFNQPFNGMIQDVKIYNSVEVPFRTVSGQIQFRGLDSFAPSVESATLEFRAPGSTVAVATVVVQLSPNGAFEVAAPNPPGAYGLSVKHTHWLRKTSILDTTNGSVTGMVIPLKNGDIDGDNEIGIGDYSVLSAAYGSVPGESNWIESSDLNHDLEINIVDYALMSLNYGSVGDE